VEVTEKLLPYEDQVDKEQGKYSTFGLQSHLIIGEGKAYHNRNPNSWHKESAERVVVLEDG
jgi:hypothetical protein